MEDTILIVDDMEVNRAILRELFVKEYRILEVQNGKEALEVMEKEKSRLAMILLDLIMPVLDGYKVLETISQNGIMKKIPVILITSDSAADSSRKGYEYGAADIIIKPFDAQIVRQRVINVIELFRHKNNLEQLVLKQTKEIEKQLNKLKESTNQVIEMLSSVVEFRNLESGQHIKRTKAFTNTLANYVAEYFKEFQLTPEKIEKITIASVLHDIGKISISDNILLKPGRLTQDEFEIMKTHTTNGSIIIDQLKFIDDQEFFDYVHEICRHHHERYDGYGYPDRLKGSEIPISAQIVSIADVYDALVSIRVYKAAYTTDEAYNMIMNGECGSFSPILLECFRLAKSDFEKIHEEES